MLVRSSEVGAITGVGAGVGIGVGVGVAVGAGDGVDVGLGDGVSSALDIADELSAKLLPASSKEQPLRTNVSDNIAARNFKLRFICEYLR